MFIPLTFISILIPVAFRLQYLKNALASNDYLFHATSPIIAAQCVLHYSIMSASLFYLKPFLAAFNSNLGASTKLDTAVATRSSERRGVSKSATKDKHTPAELSQSHSEIPSDLLQRDRSRDSKAPIIWRTQSYFVDIEDS